MVETLCNSGNVKLAAGEDFDTSITAAQFTELINQAEGQLIADTGVNWIDVYSAMNADFKQAIEQAAAAYAAVNVVRYKPSAYASLNEAITIVNINLDRYDRAVAKLKDANVYKPFGGDKIVE